MAAPVIRESPSPANGLEIYRGPTQISLRAIERELQNLWKQASSEHTGEGRPPVTRVGTLNLLALAPESTTAESALGEMLELTAHHPGRLFLLETTDGVAKPNAEVSAHCHLRSGGGQVCSEVVRLLVPHSEESSLASLVAPLLIPDLPVVLWLPGEPIGTTLPASLLRLLDRVLVDSHRSPADAAHLERLLAWDRSIRSGVTDLAWHRLERWRSLAAQLFQEECAARQLADLAEVEVEYWAADAGAPSGRAEAVYFAAWIATRLQFPPPGRRFDCARDGGWQATRPDGSRLAAHFRPRARTTEAVGDLFGIRFRTAAGTRYEIERGEASPTAAVRATDSSRPLAATSVDLRTRSRLELLRAALDDRRPDRIFSEVLRWLASAARGDR